MEGHMNNLVKLIKNEERLFDLAFPNVSKKKTARCIYCGRIYTDPIEVEYLKHNRMCLGCESIKTDTKEQQKADDYWEAQLKEEN
jgi:hypothetical protein